MTECFLDYLKKQDVEFKRFYNLKLKSSIKIGGACNTAVFPKSIYELISVLEFITENKLEFKLLGNMTNVLPRDDFYKGIIVFTSEINKYYVAENKACIECGALLSRVLRTLSNQNLGGCEELYGIPGSLGGILYSNAGAYGKSISDIFVSARVYSLTDYKICELSKSDFSFSYRHSVLKDRHFVLLDAVLQFEKSYKDIILERMSYYINRRKSEQPFGKPSLGSIFKRKDGVFISKLIDNLGLKGYSIGDAEISKKHAGFIINSGNAKASDVKKLIELIKSKLYASYGVIPEEEIEFL